MRKRTIRLLLAVAVLGGLGGSVASRPAAEGARVHAWPEPVLLRLRKKRDDGNRPARWDR